jgi:DNA-binding transcriptional ArsR family regulator
MGRQVESQRKVSRPTLDLKTMVELLAYKPVEPTDDNTIMSVRYRPVLGGSPARQAAEIEFLRVSANPVIEEASEMPPPEKRWLLPVLKKRKPTSVETMPLLALAPCQKLVIAIEELKRCQLDKASIAKASLRLFIVGLQITGRQFWDGRTFRALLCDLMSITRGVDLAALQEPTRAAMDFATDDANWLTALGEKQTVLSMSAEGMAELRRVGIEPIEFYLSRRAARVYEFLKVRVKEQDKPFMPTYDDIQDATGMNRNDVSAALKELREKGVLAPAAKR